MLGRKFQHNVRHALRDHLEARGPDALAGAPFAANAPEARKRLFEPVVPPAPFETPPQTMRVEDRAMSAAAHRLDAAPPGGGLEEVGRDARPVGGPARHRTLPTVTAASPAAPIGRAHV